MGQELIELNEDVFDLMNKIDILLERLENHPDAEIIKASTERMREKLQNNKEEIKIDIEDKEMSGFSPLHFLTLFPIQLTSERTLTL